MSSFEGRLRLPGHTKIPLGVEVDITNERLTLASGERKLGDWALKEVDIASMSDGFHINLDGEEVVLSVAETERFVSELGPAVRSGKKPTLRRPAEDRFDDLRRRIAELSDAIVSEEEPPSDVFGRWLRLLKELNRHHGQGAMTTQLFYRLNTELLELIPEPARDAATSR